MTSCTGSASSLSFSSTYTARLCTTQNAQKLLLLHGHRAAKRHHLQSQHQHSWGAVMVCRHAPPDPGRQDMSNSRHAQEVPVSTGATLMEPGYTGECCVQSLPCTAPYWLVAAACPHHTPRARSAAPAGRNEASQWLQVEGTAQVCTAQVEGELHKAATRELASQVHLYKVLR